MNSFVPKIAIISVGDKKVGQFSFDREVNDDVYYLTPISQPNEFQRVQAQAICRQLNPLINPHGYVAVSMIWKNNSYTIRIQRRKKTKQTSPFHNMLPLGNNKLYIKI
ncbi:MAG: hypothetical protein ACKKL5_01190 [Candidatus Komeilibacteria bacterium]